MEELEPLMVDDCLLRRYRSRSESGGRAAAVSAHLSVCRPCQTRLMQLEVIDTTRDLALSILLGKSQGGPAKSMSADGDFYCCPTGLAASGYADYGQDLRGVMKSMPVFPEAARSAARALARDDVSFAVLERVACSDPVFAASLVKFANSPLFPGNGVTTVRHAIRYVGLSNTRNLVLGLLVRPWLGGPALAGCWRHSLRMARRVENLSRIGGKDIPAGEAFLAGLVHDIGRFPFGRLRRFGDLRAKLEARGWPGGFVERTLFGLDHAILGGDMLRSWSFPAHIADAVKNHHTPEFAVSDLASLLYIGEEIEKTSEDASSEFRLEFALTRTGLAPGLLLESDPAVDAWANAAAAAA